MAAPQPVIIPASAVTMPAAVGTIAPGMKLRNESDVGVNVDRISFAGQFSLSSIFSLRLRNQPITNGLIPLISVAWAPNPGNESEVVDLVLTKPIYLAPGEFLDVTFNNALSVSARPVQAIAVGRQCRPEDASRYLPYLAAFSTAVYDGTSNAAIDERSGPDDLGNPFDHEMVVSHFVGRILSGPAATGLAVNTSFTQMWNYFNVRLRDDRDTFLVPRPTPLSLVVDSENYRWQVNAPLAPRSYYRLEVQGNASWGGSGGPYALSMLGMQGYRRIA